VPRKHETNIMEMPDGSRLGQPGRTAKSQALSCRPSQAAANHVVNDTPTASMLKTRLTMLCKVLVSKPSIANAQRGCATRSQERGQLMLQVGGQSPFSDI